MASTADFRSGFTFKMDGDLWSVVEFQHVKMGRSGAIVRTKLKNLQTGRVLEKTFRSGEKIDEVMVQRKPMQYLYKDSEDFVFMDQETYDQLNVSAAIVGESQKFLKEGEIVSIALHEENPVYLDMPVAVELKIKQTDPGLKGDTASGGGKPATLETGAVVSVPLFLSEGDIIKVDTRSGAYLERVKS
ncbi:MAG: elongation factor P [bacterium]